MAMAVCWTALLQAGAAGFTAGQEAQDDDEVLAEIDGYQLTRAELERIIQSIPESMRKQVDTPEGRANFVRNYLQKKAMALEALALNLSQDPTVQMGIRFSREQVLAQAFQNRTLQEIQVTDQEVDAYYEQNQESFKHPVLVELSRILVAKQKEALEIIARANDGTSFAELASTLSKDIRSRQQGGYIGWVQAGQMEPVVEQVIFGLKPGQIGPPVRTVQGWHVLQVTDRREAGYVPLDTLRERLSNQLLAEKRKEALQTIGQETFEKRGGKIHAAGKQP